MALSIRTRHRDEMKMIELERSNSKVRQRLRSRLSRMTQEFHKHRRVYSTLDLIGAMVLGFALVASIVILSIRRTYVASTEWPSKPGTVTAPVLRVISPSLSLHGHDDTDASIPMFDNDSSSSAYPFLRQSLRYGLDTTVSPCVDFDRFANGGWRDSVTIPKGVSTQDVFRFTSARTAAFLQTLLDSTPVLAHTTHDPVIRAIGRYYESCLRADSLERSLAVLSMANAPRGDTARASRCGRLVISDLPDAAGQLFVNGLLPPQAEQRVRTMVANIQRAAEKRLTRNPWMNAEAKRRVHETLKTMTLRVAKPTVIVDHSGLVLTTDDFARNRTLIKEYLWKRQVVRSQDETRAMWQMNQYTANAQYQWEPANTIEVPTFMFQWPFFDPSGQDEAMGYAGAGMIIGHEMYHGVTMSAAAAGNAGYNARRDRLIAQYDALRPSDGVPITGKSSILESLPDLGGLMTAYDAWSVAGGAKHRALIDGFTPEQRFFLHYARVWRSKDTRGYAGTMRNKSHPPHWARINGVLPNIPAFAKAFGCRAGDPMAHTESDRVDMW